jgi:D-lactate dehydrogenase (cytochrome)
VLDLERGECLAHPDGYFEIVLGGGEIVRVELPRYSVPRVPKCSAGYRVAPRMDLVDLFVGSEGTLGVVTAVELRLVAARPVLWGWLTLDNEASALAVVAALRAAALTARAEGDPRGLDVAAIESLDGRSLALLREDGADRTYQTSLPGSSQAALLFQIELPTGTGPAQALAAIEGAEEEAGADTALGRLVRLVEQHGDLDRLELVLPGEATRVAQLLSLREAVPEAVNRRIAAAQRAAGPGVRKTAGDMIVPFEALAEKLRRDREALTRRGLDHAIWGHVSDGNLHENVRPRSAEDTRAGEEALLELGAAAIELGGSPLAEHGVGRNPVKQALLRLLYGDEGVAAMRRVKAALDPSWKLAPGVLFPRSA